MIKLKRNLKFICHSTLICCAVMLVLIIVLSMFTNIVAPIENKVRELFYEITARAGLELKSIEVLGTKNAHIQPHEIINITSKKKLSIFQVNLPDVQQNILNNPWVDKVVIHRLLPNTIKIILNEKSPFAIWQCNGQFSVIDQEGGRIAIQHIPLTCRNLPHIIGKNANINALPFLSLLNQYPAIKVLIKSYHYRNSRRWDLITTRDQMIKMPEKNLDKALKYLEKLCNNGSLNDKNVTMIDLRDNQRYYIRKRK